MAGPGRIGGLLLGRRGPAAPLPSGERSWRSRAGKEPERGAEGRGDGGGGDPVPEPWARDFFGPFRPTKESGKKSRQRPRCSSAGRAYPPMRKVCRGGARNGGSRDRGIEAFVQSVAGSESGRSSSLLRLVGPLPAQDLFRAGRPPVATTIARPSLRSCPRLFVWCPPLRGSAPVFSFSPRGEERGLVVRGRARKGPEEAGRRGGHASLFSFLDHSLSSPSRPLPGSPVSSLRFQR